MSDWSTSRAALQLHSAAYEIEAAWEDSRPVTRAMCEQYHAAADDALVADMPEDKRIAEAAKLRAWAQKGIIPAPGAKWAEYVATMLEDKRPAHRPPLAPDAGRTSRFVMRTHPDIKAKIMRNGGTAWVEELVKRAKEKE